jgi:hypothetical protein
MALKCHACRTHFCGWCLARCGDDAHPHVRGCAKRLSADLLFGTRAEFERSCRERQGPQLARFLGTLAPALAARVVQSLRRQLADAGLGVALRRFGM